MSQTLGTLLKGSFRWRAVTELKLGDVIALFLHWSTLRNEAEELYDHTQRPPDRTDASASAERYKKMQTLLEKMSYSVIDSRSESNIV